MPVHDLHEKPFDVNTQEKLELYREYLREWLPVFIHYPKLEALQIFDFFAGPGSDVDGQPGSPKIACEEAKDAIAHRRTSSPPPTIKFFFNEYEKSKNEQLVESISSFKKLVPEGVFAHSQMDFAASFKNWVNLMRQKKVANLIFLDQNGFKQITKNVFEEIVQLPCTDFIFFISSAMINRFKTESEAIKHLPISEEDISKMNGTNVHRIIAESYRRWLPVGLKYYMAPFSIKKGANVYGLVFGSGHQLGMETCWGLWRRCELRYRW